MVEKSKDRKLFQTFQNGILAIRVYLYKRFYFQRYRFLIDRSKEEPRLVRYRDDKVVSTKGEKIVVESPSEDHLKHTFVSIRPLRRWRFH
jgi:hypothetical protein